MDINTTAIDQVLEAMANANEKRFNAHQVTSLSNEKDVMAVNDYLLYKSNGDYATLIAKVETICDNNHPDEHFNFGETLPDYEIECRVCGNEYIPTLEYSHLVFYFNDKFKSDVKKKESFQQYHRILTLAY